jgi:hypothetical protein
MIEIGKFRFSAYVVPSWTFWRTFGVGCFNLERCVPITMLNIELEEGQREGDMGPLLEFFLRHTDKHSIGHVLFWTEGRRHPLLPDGF